MLLEEGRQVVVKPDSSMIDLWNSLFFNLQNTRLAFYLCILKRFPGKKHKQYMNPVPYRSPLYQDHSRFCSFPQKTDVGPPSIGLTPAMCAVFMFNGI